MDNHFREEKIRELTEKIVILQEENKSLRDYIHNLEANQTGSENSRSIAEGPIFPPFNVPSDNELNRLDVR